MLQTVVVDARGHMLGRLASIVAKQLLNGQHVVRLHSSGPAAAEGFSHTSRCMTADPGVRSLCERRRSAYQVAS